MKFLCLHGSGTSGQIFEIQTSMLRASLDTSKHHFDFIDAPHAWHAGPGVSSFFDGPYFAWWKNHTAGDVKQATQALLQRMREQDAPYDAVLCFSQGCSILSSLILFHQMEYPDQPLPFRSAVFICGGIPLYVLDTWLPVSETALAIADRSIQNLHAASAAAPKKLDAYLETGIRPRIWDLPTGLWDAGNDDQGPSWETPPLDPTDVFGLDLSAVPRDLRIQIPTVHVYGHKDPVCTSSLQLAMLCEGEKLVYDHGGGHEIPRSTRVSKDIAEAIRWLEKQIS